MLTSETIHASCVSIAGEAVLIVGPSGSGKSDLALRLIDRGATLVSDDYTILHRVGKELRARAPETIKDKIEVRTVGIVTMQSVQDIRVSLIVDVGEPGERFPFEPLTRQFAGIDLPLTLINPFESSAPIKAELALKQLKAL